MKPLQGQKILLTRPRSQSRGISAGLERLGARVLAAPAIRTVPPASWKGLDRALRELSRYPILGLPSANGVESFFSRSRKVSGREPKPPSRLYAIGPATAKALRGHGWRPGMDRDGEHHVIFGYNQSTVYANTVLAVAEKLKDRNRPRP